MIAIRDETPRDAEAIEAITAEAFRTAPHASGTEQFIVRALRQAGHLTVSLVAEVGGHAAGHVAVSPITIAPAAPNWFGLGPVSVVPEHQGIGIGRILVTKALEKLRVSGAAGCVVLGEPAYYARFGFSPCRGLVLPGVPQEYFQAISFVGATPTGRVAYHQAFQTTA